MSVEEGISAKVISQISMMQSVVAQLPNTLSILDFVKKGLIDISGIVNVKYEIFAYSMENEAPQCNEKEKAYVIKRNDITYAIIIVSVSDEEIFALYETFIENFCNMLAFIFEEKRLKDLNKNFLKELESIVEVRTRELNRRIREKEKAQNLYKATSIQTKAILESIGDGVIATDCLGNVISMNPVAEQITGYKLSNSVGKPIETIFTIYDDEFIQKLSDNNENYYSTLKNYTLPEKSLLLNKRKKEIHIIHSVASISQVDGENGIVIIFRDNSENYEREYESICRVKRIQKQNTSLVELYSVGLNDESISAKSIEVFTEVISKTLDVVRIGIWLFLKNLTEISCLDQYVSSKKIHEKGEVYTQNQLPRYFNAQKKEWMIVADDITTCEYLSELSESYIKELDIASMVDITIRLDDNPFGILCIEHTGEKRVWHEDEVSYIRAVSQQVGRYFFLVQHKLLEKKLRQSQKMEAIGELAGGIAHDFNNMLGGIMGATQVLLTSIDKEDSKSMKFVRIVEKATKRSADLASKLLVFSRNSNVNLKITGMNEIVNDSISLLERTIDKSIVLTTHLTSENSGVLADESQIQNLIMNLCINSSHAMLKGGTITITTSTVYLDERYCSTSPFSVEVGSYVELEVKDDGYGIAKEILPKIFDPFFTTKEQGKGTGLGLSTAYGVVKSHNGVITVDSEINKGTSFRIYLPMNDREEVLYESLELKNGNGSILLVDDEEIIRETALALLEDMGYNVIVAENGRVAVELYKEYKSQIDLVILDMVMPVMGGRETFLRLKEVSENVTIILSSGFAKTEDIDALKKYGLFGFISKPYVKSELSNIVYSAIYNKNDVSYLVK